MAPFAQTCAQSREHEAGFGAIEAQDIDGGIEETMTPDLWLSRRPIHQPSGCVFAISNSTRPRLHDPRFDGLRPGNKPFIVDSLSCSCHRELASHPWRMRPMNVFRHAHIGAANVRAHGL